MLLSLNPSSGIPLYRQMAQQLRQRMVSGQLAANARLPSVREMSAEMKVNPLTVAKVYQILEREGLVEFRRGLGTFVTSQKVMGSLTEKRRLIVPSVEQVVVEARQLQLAETEVQHLLHEQFKKTS